MGDLTHHHGRLTPHHRRLTPRHGNLTPHYGRLTPHHGHLTVPPWAFRLEYEQLFIADIIKGKGVGLLSDIKSEDSSTDFIFYSYSFVCHSNFQHIATSVLSGTHLHLSQVKHGRVKCLGQEHNIGAMTQHGEERNMIFL